MRTSEDVKEVYNHSMSTVVTARAQIPLQSDVSHSHCKMFEAVVALCRKLIRLSMSKTFIEFLLCVQYNSRDLAAGRVIKEKDVVLLSRNIKSTYRETANEHKIQVNTFMGNACLPEGLAHEKAESEKLQVILC